MSSGRRLRGDGVLAGLDLDGAVAAHRGDELLGAPAGGLFQVAGHGEGGEHDGEVGLDGGSWPGCASIHFRAA